MKRKLLIDLDDSRAQQIMIGPVQDSPNQKVKPQPLFDMGLLCEALCTMIHLCDKEGIEKDHVSLEKCISHLKKGFIDESYKAGLKE